MDSEYICSVTVAETRKSLGKRLGEIIEDIFGDKRVRELFVDNKHPAAYEGKPTGMMALDLGVISLDTKTALLVAQAAERTLKLAEKVESYVRNGKKIPDVKAAGFVKWDDPVFKFVGSDRDPLILQSAQATWMGAQLYLNDVIESVDDKVRVKESTDYADGFKQAAMESYKEAAVLLKKEGHENAADKISGVVASLGKPALNKLVENAPPPYNFLSTKLKDFTSSAAIKGFAGLPEYERVLEKLVRLTNTDTASIEAAKVKKKQQTPSL